MYDTKDAVGRAGGVPANAFSNASRAGSIRREWKPCDVRKRCVPTPWASSASQTALTAEAGPEITHSSGALTAARSTLSRTARTEERRVGKEWGCRSWGSPYHIK